MFPKFYIQKIIWGIAECVMKVIKLNYLLQYLKSLFSKTEPKIKNSCSNIKIIAHIKISQHTDIRRNFPRIILFKHL